MKSVCGMTSLCESCIIFTDGSVFATCIDTGTIWKLYLTTSCERYSILYPDGRLHHHFTRTALSSHTSMLQAVIRHRNRYIAASPCADRLTPFCHVSILSKSELSATSRQILKKRKLQWPSSELIRHDHASLYNSETMQSEMRSLDGTARVCVSYDGRIVDAYYMTSVYDGDTGKSIGSVSQHQTFPAESTPFYFQYPVNILRQSAQTTSAPRTSVIPEGIACDSAKESVKQLIIVERLLKCGSVASIKSVAVEIRNNCVYFLNNEARRVNVYLESELLLLECEQRYFKLIRQDGSTLQQFTNDTIPVSMSSILSQPAINQTSVSIQKVCEHALQLLSLCKHYKSSMPVKAAKKIDLETTKVVTEVEEALGTFRAYEGGRVRVLFSDRCILDLKENVYSCLLPCGRSITGTIAAVENSHCMYMYISAALCFAEYAFMTPKMRVGRMNAMQKRSELVEKELSKIWICSRSNKLLVSMESNISATAEARQLGMDRVSEALAQTAAQMERIQALLKIESAMED